jgi:hypothetical protein
MADLSAHEKLGGVFSPPLQGEGWVGMGFDFRVDFPRLVIPAKASARRHPGESRDPVLLGSFRETDPRPCVFSLAIPGERVTSLCLPKEK